MFREVIDNALDAITIVGPDGNYRYQNRAAWEISGYSPDDPGEVNAFQHIHPEDLERVRTVFTKGLQGGTPLAATFRYRKKDGSWQWLEVAGISLLNNPLVKGAILFSRDITEQRTAQTRVQEARDRLDAIINAIGDPVFVKDTEHRWVLVNDAFCRLVGKSKDELLGKSDYDAFPAPQADAAWAKDAEVLASGAEIATEEVLNDAKGNPQYLFTKKTVYTDPSGVKFIVGIMRDISVLRRARETEARAEELERLNKVMVGRELRMIELKKENERLADELRQLQGKAS
jgi:PAS domain S-box-containing protein